MGFTISLQDLGGLCLGLCTLQSKQMLNHLQRTQNWPLTSLTDPSTLQGTKSAGIKFDSFTMFHLHLGATCYCFVGGEQIILVDGSWGTHFVDHLDSDRKKYPSCSDVPELVVGDCVF